MSNQSALLLLTTETALHAGTGQSVSGIDLPIQREVHTGWPCVYGSSVKGALRAHAFHHETGKDHAVELFGPELGRTLGEDEAHAGALLVGDALLLALPVRSLQSAFKWVTCPQAINRFVKHAERLGLQISAAEISVTDKNTALGNGDATLFLQEFRFEQTGNEAINMLAQTLAQMSGGALQQEALQQQLVIVHDDIFTFLSQNATAVNAHIAIDAQTKTVKDGALWYEETLPPETILYVPLTATASRKRGSEKTAAQVLACFETLLPAGNNWLQLGGNETTGMGWCRVGINKVQQA